jgi:hypothetical protein
MLFYKLKDLNPIELVWNDLKYYLANHYKPNNLS